MFRSSLKIISVLLALLIAVPSFAGTEEDKKKITLEDLDAIVTQAPNLTAFLASKELVDAYYEGLKKYFGEDHFAREPYDAILKQLGELNKQFPEIAERAWEVPKQSGSFIIQLMVKSSGLILKARAFETWIQKWKKELEEKVGTRTDSELSQVAEDLDKEIGEHYLAVAKLSRTERPRASATFFRDFTARADFQQLAARALLLRLSEESVSDRLLSGDADTVLYELANLRKSGAFAISGKALPEHLQSFLGRGVPVLETPPLQVKDGKGLSNELFTVETTVTKRGRVIPVGQGSVVKYLSRPIPRRIHAFYKGIYLKECIAGRCESLDSITPERWATPLMETADFHSIEKLTPSGPDYQGFAQMITGQIGEKSFQSVDFGSVLFGRKVIAADPSAEIFYDLWIKEASKHLPQGVEGMVLSEATSGDNAGVLGAIRSRPSYLMGELADPQNRFVVTDDLVKRLASLGFREGHAGQYAGRMVYDAVLPDGGKLTILKPFAEWPKELRLNVAMDLLKGNKGTKKKYETLSKHMSAHVAPLTPDERKQLFAQADQIGSDAFLHLLAALIEKPTEAEGLVVSKMGGEKFLEKVGFLGEATVRPLLDKIWSDSKAEPHAETLKKIANHESLLRGFFDRPKVALAAAVALQALGHQDAETDAVIINIFKEAADTKKFEGWHDTLIEKYLENTSEPSALFLDQIIEFGFNHRRTVSRAIRDLLYKHLPLTPKRRELTIRALAQSERGTDSQFHIAALLMRDGSPPPEAQAVFLIDMTNKDFDTKNIQEKLNGLKQIDLKALQLMTERMPKMDGDEMWIALKFLRDAKNIAVEDLRQALEGFLNSDSDKMRFAAARVLAAHKVRLPRIEEIILYEGLNSWTGERTILIVGQNFQVSEQGRNYLIDRIEGGDVAEHPRDLLITQQGLTPAQISRLRTLQYHPRSGTSLRAASALLALDLADSRTLEVLIEALDADWDVKTSVERVRQALERVPLDSSTQVGLEIIRIRQPKEYEKIRDLIAYKPIEYKGILKADLDLFFKKIEEDKRTQAEVTVSDSEVRAFARLLINPQFPRPDLAYNLIKKNMRALDDQPLLQKGLQSSAMDIRYYSALLLEKRFGQSDLKIQEALVPLYGFADVPRTRLYWDKKFLPILMRDWARYDELNGNRQKALDEMFIHSNLPAEARQKFKQDSEHEPSRTKKYTANQILDGIEAREAKMTQKFGVFKPVEMSAVEKGLWELEHNSDPFVGKGILDKYLEANKFTEEEKARLRQLLSSKKISVQMIAAVLLESSGEWSPAIERALLRKPMDDGPDMFRWNEEYFVKRLEAHGLSDEAFKDILEWLKDENKRFRVTDHLLGGFENLSEAQVNQLRALQIGENSAQRAMAAAILLLRGGSSKTSRRIIFLEGLDHKVSANFITKRLKGFDPDPKDCELFVQKMAIVKKVKKSDIHNDWMSVYFGFENPGPNLLASYRAQLVSDDVGLSLNAALKLVDLERTPEVEAALVRGLTDQSTEWNYGYFFKKLEKDTRLEDSSQVALARLVVGPSAKSQPYARQLLLNQLTLAPEAAVILKTSNDPLAREILQNKKTPAAQLNGSCEGAAAGK